MVSHLTADLHKGKEVTLKDFMSRCAMDIDFNKRSRETAFTGELPVYEPDTKYNESQLENAKKKLAEMKAKTDEELDAYLLEQFEVSKQMYEKTKAEKAALKIPYMEMLDKIKAWTPPTSEHEFLKGYAVGIIERGIENDCTVYSQEPELQDREEYRQMCIEMYERDIVFAQERIDREIESCKKSNEWNRALLHSIVTFDHDKDIDGITAFGYYLKSDFDTLQQHTPTTLALFERGLDTKEVVTDEDMLDLVHYNENKEMYCAEWHNPTTGTHYIYFK